MQSETIDSGETTATEAELQRREVMDDLTFLAREFLTWLAYHAETADGAFTGSQLLETPPFSIRFAGKVALRTPAGLVTDMTLKGPDPISSADLCYALAGGLAVKEADFRLEQGEQAWSFALAAEHFDLKRVKVPALLDQEADDPAPERLALLQQLDSLVWLAFNHFMGLRASGRWGAEVVPAIRQWLDANT